MDRSTDIEKARYNVSNLLNVYSPSEIIFTSGATESNNMAILGSTIYSNNMSSVVSFPMNCRNNEDQTFQGMSQLTVERV